MNEKKPNFLIIVADDLGFTDLGCFGGEINTPNLDRLSQTGVRFTDFHTASACSPTRSMLLSGTDNHIAGLGQMAEFARQLPEVFGGKPGYEGYLNFRVAALPEILKDAGYYNILSGKWHLGLTSEYWPGKRGFEKSFTLLPGAGNHYKYFPKEGGEHIQFMKPIFEEDGQEFNPDNLPDDYYSTSYFTEKFIERLNSHSREDRPFFGLLTYTAPHWPYQAPAQVISKYRGVYDDGPLELRKRRLAKAKELGLLEQEVKPHQTETQRNQEWSDLTDDQKAIESKIMETYAGMVETLDRNVGKVLDHLEKTGELENTFILFMSDNGAEGMMMEALPLQNERFATNVAKYYDNSLANIGKKDSFVWYSDQWAQAATAPYYMYKMWASEGGIRCPLLVHFPPLVKSPGRIQDGFITVMDILPTVLDLAGVSHPGSIFHGREVVKPRGSSWRPLLEGSASEIHQETVVGWELFAQQAIRKGEWKALFIPAPMGPNQWQLFNLKEDRGETTDLAVSEPQRLKEMVEYWAEYVAETGLVECLDTFNDGLKAVYERTEIHDV